MTMYSCPQCETTITDQHEVPGHPRLYACRCGMVFRAMISDIHLTVGDDKKARMREVIDATLQVYQTKDKHENEHREFVKQKSLDYLVEELCKGPILGGTIAQGSSIAEMFGTDVWKALQKAVLIRDEKCMICGQKPSMECHHIRPRHLGGKDHPRNLIGLCLECHDEVHRRIDEGIQEVVEKSLDIDLKPNATSLDKWTEAEQ